LPQIAYIAHALEKWSPTCTPSTVEVLDSLPFDMVLVLEPLCMQDIQFHPTTNVRVLLNAKEPLVLMTRSNLVVAEGGDAVEYGVSLNAAPTSTVEITVNVGDDLLADPVSLIFTVDDWNVVPTVAVSARDDSFAESTENHAITHAIASDDARYNGCVVEWELDGVVGSSATILVSVYDNNVPGATLQ
jgi:hypothetical protein